MGEIIETDVEGESPNGSAIVFNVPDLKAMAAKILRRANEVAQQTVNAARQNAAEQEKQARAAGEKIGHADGLKKGETEGRIAGEKAAREEFAQQTSTVAAALQATLEEVNVQKRVLLAEAEADLLRLAMEIARRIVRREVRLDEEFIVPIVREAIALTNNRSDLLVWLNPADLSAIERELPHLQALFSDLGRVELREDPTVERGGVRVLNREGEVDMSLGAQLQALELALVGDTRGLELALQHSAIPPARSVHAPVPENPGGGEKTEANPGSETVEAGKDSPGAAPASSASPSPAPATPEKSSPATAPAAAAPTARPAAVPENTFQPGWGDANTACSLDGLPGLEAIPVDPAQEKLIDEVLRARR